MICPQTFKLGFILNMKVHFGSQQPIFILYVQLDIAMFQ